MLEIFLSFDQMWTDERLEAMRCVFNLYCEVQDPGSLSFFFFFNSIGQIKL